MHPRYSSSSSNYQNHKYNPVSKYRNSPDSKIPERSFKKKHKADYSRLHDENDFNKSSPRKKKRRVSDHELFEIEQLIRTGVLKPSDHPHFNKDTGTTIDTSDSTENEIDVEIIEDHSNINLHTVQNPIRIFRMPEGSLARSAQNQVEILNQRREDQKKTISQADVNQKIRKTSGTQEKRITAEMISKWKQQNIIQNLAKIKNQISKKSVSQQISELPITKLKESLIAAFNEHRVMVVVGETGSGKTTQMPQYFYQSGFAKGGKYIACTQPRRVAAKSIARRVATEMHTRCGDLCGYTIRFDDCTSPMTRIKYMTDGMLLREATADPYLNKYSVIILDEAHERNLTTDVLFGLMKKILSVRKDIRIIATSATLDAEKFANFFGGCPIFTIKGRMYKVKIFHALKPSNDYLTAAVDACMKIHLKQGPGDILVFLTGQEEIEMCCEMLNERLEKLRSSTNDEQDVPPYAILPLYAQLPPQLQGKIFDPPPPNGRKIIFSTNIAETSLTIDGISYVVDSGFVKQLVYDPRTGMDQLTITPISQAAAKQRAGRAGRTGPGQAYRLYTVAAYKNEMLANPLPEIQRTNLISTTLSLKSMGIHDVLSFDFIDPPPRILLQNALKQLFILGALDESGYLLPIGKQMAQFPLTPQLAKMLIASIDLRCHEEILSIVSLLSVPNLFYRPKNLETKADQRHEQFHSSDGDHLTLLNVFNHWRNSNNSTQWCRDNFIQFRNLEQCLKIRGQLEQLLSKHIKHPQEKYAETKNILKAITAGFFANVARIDAQEGYKTIVEGQVVYIHPSSSLFRRNPRWVIYNQLVMTSKEYMRNIIAIEPQWLVEFAPNYFQKVDPSTTLTRNRKMEKITPLFDRRLTDQDSWRLSRRK